MDSEKMMVCSVFDVVAKEHGPLFFAKNMGLLWRNVDGLVRAASNVDPSEFVVFVHGDFDVRESHVPLSVFSLPTCWTVSRQPLSAKQIEQLCEKALEAGGPSF